MEYIFYSFLSFVIFACYFSIFARRFKLANKVWFIFCIDWLDNYHALDIALLLSQLMFPSPDHQIPSYMCLLTIGLSRNMKVKYPTTPNTYVLSSSNLTYTFQPFLCLSPLMVCFCLKILQQQKILGL